MPKFNIPDFLRLIGKGPVEYMRYWQGVPYALDGPPLYECAAPFADILDHFTPDKDALLLGAGLEWWRENQTDEIDGAVYKIGFGSNMFWESELLRDPKPGERLARAIWAAMKGDK
jgi:hypothetical protein